MSNTSTINPTGAGASTSLFPVVYYLIPTSSRNPSPSQPQPQSISSFVNPEKTPVNISVNISQPEDNSLAALQTAYFAGLSEKTSSRLQRKKDFWDTMRALAQALLVGAATIGATIGGLYLLSASGRHAIRQNRQALFNEHLPKNEQSSAISFQDFLKEHKGNLTSNLSNGQLRTALVEIPNLEGKSEYLHAVLSGDSVYSHNDTKTGARILFALQKDNEGNILLEKKPIDNDLPVLRLHSHPMNVNEKGELSFPSHLRSILEGVQGTLIKAIGGDFNPSKRSVEQTHFSDRVPSHINYGGYFSFGDGMWTALAFSELFRIAVDR